MVYKLKLRKGELKDNLLLEKLEEFKEYSFNKNPPIWCHVGTDVELVNEKSQAIGRARITKLEFLEDKDTTEGRFKVYEIYKKWKRINYNYS